jgi:4'-phosphopantetheinyl transferase
MGIDAWFLETESCSAAARDASRALLSADERARHDRFACERVRRDFAFAHSLARTTLSRYDRIDAAAWTFGTADNGKPCIVSGTSRPLSFNLSHTHGFVACVVAPGIDVGVDVESVDRKIEVDDIAERYFAGIEIDALHALRGTERVERFFELWTLKEAYLKAVGIGLSHALDPVSFVLRNGEIVFTPPPVGHPEDWQFALFAPTPRYRLAVAARRSGRPHAVSAMDAASGGKSTARRICVSSLRHL